MKAEELKTKIRYAIATSIHSNPNSLGFQGYDTATEKCLKIIDDYARIQIEKDREDACNKIVGYATKEVVKGIIRNRPIIID